MLLVGHPRTPAMQDVRKSSDHGQRISQLVGYQAEDFLG
jgi:hypothetical protein